MPCKIGQFFFFLCLLTASYATSSRFEAEESRIIMFDSATVVMQCNDYGSQQDRLHYVYVQSEEQEYNTSLVRDRVTFHGVETINDTFKIAFWHIRSHPELHGLKLRVETLSEASTSYNTTPTDCRYTFQYLPCPSKSIALASVGTEVITHMSMLLIIYILTG